MINQKLATCLVLNGALLMLAGLICGALVPVVPYPRLMLAAHITGFGLSGVVSMLAGLVVGSSFCVLSPWAGKAVLLGHVLLWPMALSEVAGAFWGTNKVLVIAAAQAGATGGTAWQEAVVGVCHALPAFALTAAWIGLSLGAYQAYRAEGGQTRGHAAGIN